MTCITTPDNVEYCDGTYESVCVREKTLTTFAGTVQLTEDGCLIATGPCSSCGRPITAVLYISQ